MPRFSEVYTSAQGGAVPTAGPTAAALTLGFWFRLSRAAQFVGWRFYTQNGTKGNLWGTVWAADLTTQLAIGITSLKLANSLQVGDGWRNFYAHPRALLQADTDYLLAVATDSNGIYRTPNFFVSGPLVNDFITLPQTEPGSTDHNGVFADPFTFNNPPESTSGHLYGIDMLVL